MPTEEKKSSYLKREEQRKINTLKNEIHYKVFTSLHWLAKEEMPSSKINLLLTLLEQIGVKEIKYFEKRSETILRKMLLLVAKVMIEDLVNKIKKSNVFSLLIDEVTDISNVCQLVPFVKLYDVDKEKANTVFLDCSDLLEYSPDASPDANAIVTCITKKFKDLTIEISKVNAFASDGAAVMNGLKRRSCF